MIDSISLLLVYCSCPVLDVRGGSVKRFASVHVSLEEDVDLTISFFHNVLGTTTLKKMYTDMHPFHSKSAFRTLILKLFVSICSGSNYFPDCLICQFK